MIELGANRYGKAAIRLVRVMRGPDGDRVRDLTVAIALEGDFAAAHTDGDNALVIATDTMKNTAYAFAEDHLDGSIEDYGRALAEHFLEAPRSTSRRSTCVPTTGRDRRRWDAGPRRVRARWRGDTGRDGRRRRPAATTVEAGVEDLIVMKTTRSAFSGFPRDRYTTLPETDDRLMATKVTAIWRYGSPDLDFDTTFAGRPDDPARGLRRPRQPVGPDVDLDHGQGDPRAARGGGGGPHGPAQPPSLAGRPVAVRARATTARSTRRRPSRTA